MPSKFVHRFWWWEMRTDGQTQYSPYDAIRVIYVAQRARRLTVVPPFPVQYGVFVICPFWKLECKCWSHYVRHNYKYVYNYSMGSKLRIFVPRVMVPFQTHSHWSPLIAPVLVPFKYPQPKVTCAISVPSVHRYLCHSNTLSSPLLVPFKYPQSTVTCAI